MTTKDEIGEWIHGAIDKGASHLIVVCDRFWHEDYPVSVMSNENIRQRIADIETHGMQNPIEVYNLNMDIEEQLNKEKAWNL